jgi:hypothetical protein
MAKAKKLSADQQRQEDLFRDFGIMALSAGMPVDQIKNFLTGGMLYVPQKLQCSVHAAARSCDSRCPACQSLMDANKPIEENCKVCGPVAVGFAGGRGSGKSACWFGQIFLDDLKRFPGLKFLILRKSVKALREQMRDMLRKTLLKDSYNYREQAGIVEMPNGSFAIIGHFKDESEIDNYLGQEYDGILIEELTTLTWDKIKNIRSCLRSSKKGWRPRMYASWNWGGLSHAQVKQYFYDPWKEDRQISTRFIFGTVHDNAHNNPEYIAELKSYAGWKYQSWYLGDPNFNAGAFFANFRRDVNVYPTKETQFDRNKVIRWFGGLDYGFSHPTAFGLGCETVDGDIFIVRTYSQSQTVISEHAANIKDMCALMNIDISDLEFIAAGKDCFKVDKDGGTVATSYREHGIELTAVHIDRINAWSQCQEVIGNPERGIRPRCFIHESCNDLVFQIEVAQNDPKKPGDIIKMNADSETGEGGDDLLEMWRNIITMIYSSLVSTAIPVQMGDYKSSSDARQIDGQTIEADAVVVLAGGTIGQMEDMLDMEERD